MSVHAKVPRGTFDVLPEEAAARERVERKCKAVLEAAGYRRVETPTFESTELFARGVGEATDIVRKEMFTFDDGGGRSVTLRPEGTAPVCRAYVEHGMHKLPQPVKLWYHSPFYRRERMQAGRYRQFWQIGAEALGSDDPALDAELIVLLATVLEELGVRGTRLRLASLGKASTRREYRELLKAHLHSHADALSGEARARIELNPLRAFDSDDDGTRAVMFTAPRLLDHLDAEDAEHFLTVRHLLDDAGVPHEIDSTLVRGLDYYQRTVFEFTSDALGAQSGVGGGGRYDSLVELLGGPPTPGIGWAAGVERILLAGKMRMAPARSLDLYVAFVNGPLRRLAFALVTAARKAGLSAEMELTGRSMKGQQKAADRLRARFLAEVMDGHVALRDRRAGVEREISTSAHASQPPQAAEEIVQSLLELRGAR